MPETTLREQLADALEGAPEAEAPEEIRGATEDGDSDASPASTQTDADSPPGDRAEQATQAGTSEQAAPQPESHDEPAQPPRRAPSSWKKEYWQDYAKLDPRIQDYIDRREREFASGVSTYRAEAERSHELWGAIAPFQRDLEAHGITPARWVATLGGAHHKLVNGSAQERLATFQQLAAQYQVPAQLAVQGQNGQWQLLAPQAPGQPAPQAAAQASGQPAQAIPPLDVRALVRQELEDEKSNSEVQGMLADTAGFPHFKAVAGSMAGLLRAGLAHDLGSAYAAALRLPAHAPLYERTQQQRRQAAEAESRSRQQAAVARARANAVSPKTATPSSNMASGGKKGLRDTLSDAVEAVSSGRV